MLNDIPALLLPQAGRGAGEWPAVSTEQTWQPGAAHEPRLIYALWGKGHGFLCGGFIAHRWLPDSCKATPFNNPGEATDYRDKHQAKDWPPGVVAVEVVTKPGSFERLLILPEATAEELHDRPLPIRWAGVYPWK